MVKGDTFHHSREGMVARAEGQLVTLHPQLGDNKRLYVSPSLLCIQPGSQTMELGATCI